MSSLEDRVFFASFLLEGLESSVENALRYPTEVVVVEEKQKSFRSHVKHLCADISERMILLVYAVHTLS
jgi:hypothetical protein